MEVFTLKIVQRSNGYTIKISFIQSGSFYIEDYIKIERLRVLRKTISLFSISFEENMTILL